MSDKISVKIASVIILLGGIALILCTCAKPVSLQTFLEDETVQEIIDSSQEKVKIDPGSEEFATLRAGTRRIQGLNSGKYYLIEKVSDADNNPVTGYPRYVTDYQGIGPGGLINDLGFITRISGGSINGLTNFYTYTVRTATQFPDNASIPYNDGSGAGTKAITGGVINITDINGTGSLNLSGVLTGTYEVMAVSVANPADSPWSWTSKTANLTAFTLEGPGTTVDYVFFRSAPFDFKVLRVNIAAAATTINLSAIGGVTAPATGGAPVTGITETAQYTGTVAWTPAAATFAASTTYTATITLTAKPGFTLQGVGANYFTVAGATTVTNPASSGVITAAFPATGVAPPTTGDVSFTVTFINTEQAIISGTATISRGALDGTSNTVLTLGNPPGGGTWASIAWTLENISGGTAAACTITNGGVFLPLFADNKIDVYVNAVSAGVPYSGTVSITVVP